MSGDELARFRASINELDRTILAAVNHRLGLVAELKRYKDERDLAFVDPEREAQLLDDLVRANDGPLSDEGVRALFVALLALTKRELSS
jgi:chorismate mutase/prephenate dehydratase